VSRRPTGSVPTGLPDACGAADLDRRGIMEILRLHHVAIIGSDYERTRRFYVQILGLEVFSEIIRELL
jgi:hypothetical protein